MDIGTLLLQLLDPGLHVGELVLELLDLVLVGPEGLVEGLCQQIRHGLWLGRGHSDGAHGLAETLVVHAVVLGTPHVLVLLVLVLRLRVGHLLLLLLLLLLAEHVVVVHGVWDVLLVLCGAVGVPAAGVGAFLVVVVGEGACGAVVFNVGVCARAAFEEHGEGGKRARRARMALAGLDYILGWLAEPGGNGRWEAGRRDRTLGLF